MRIAGMLVVLALSLGSLPVRAETARSLTLAQALSLARKANRNLVAGRAHLEQARTNIDSAFAVLFPTVTAQGKYARNNMEFKFPSASGQTLTIQPTNQLDGVIAFTQPLIAPAAYPALTAVKAGFRAAEAEYEVSETTVLFAVAQAFYAAAIADEIVAARQSNIQVATATLQNAKTRFDAGAVTKVDVARAEMAVVRAEQADREAREGRRQAYRALGTLIQAEPEGLKVQPGKAPVGGEAIDADLVLRLRPEFRALSAAVASAQATSRAHAWRWAPSLSLFGNARIFNYDNFAREHHAWAIGGQLEWMIYDGGTRDAQRHAANAMAEEANARAAAMADTIRDELANARGQLETKRFAHTAAERQVALARETLALVRTQYEAGQTAQIDLLQAQDSLVAAEEAVAKAHFEEALADLSLRRAAGTFPGR